MLLAEFILRDQNKRVKDVARRIGVTPSLVSRMVLGRSRCYPKLQRDIAEALEWRGDPADLFRPVEVKLTDDEQDE